MALTLPAHAANDTWGGASSNVWALGSNWTTGTAPGVGDTGTFNSSGNSNTILDFGTGVSVGNILFDTGAVAHTIGAGSVGSQALTLANGGSITMNAGVTSSQLFNSTLTLGTDGTAQTFTIANNSSTASDVMAFAGNVTGSTGTGLKTLVLTGSNAGNLNASSSTVDNVFTGVISDGTSGTVGIVKNGAGTWVLNPGAGLAKDTFTGGITINGGALIVQGTSNPTFVTNRVSASNSVTMNGGTFGVDGAGVSVGAGAAVAQTFSGLSSATGANTVYVGREAQNNANITFTNVTRAVGSTIAFSGAGAAQDTFGGTQPSSGTTVGLNGNFYLGTFNGTSVSSGFLDPGTFANSGTQYAYYDTNTTNGGLVVGVRGINYVSNTVSGIDAVNPDAGAIQSTGGSSVTGTFVQTTGTITAEATTTMTTLNLGAAANIFTMGSGNTLTVNGILLAKDTSTPAPTGTISGGSGIMASTNSEMVMSVYGSGNLTITSIILANGSNTLTKTGTGTLTLAADNLFAGNVVISQGTITLGATSTTSSGGGLGLVSNSVLIEDAGTLDVGGRTDSTGVVTMGITGLSNGNVVQARIINSAGSAGGIKTFTTSGVTVNSVGNSIGTFVSVGGNVTQTANSVLTVAGQIANDTLASGAMLAGTGSTGIITLNSGAILSPGVNGTGALNAVTSSTTNSLVWNGGASLAFNLSTTSANASTQLNLNGIFDKGTSGIFDVFLTGGTSTSTTYDLINFVSASGFSNGDFVLVGSSGLTGNFVLTGTQLDFNITGVPEPATVWLTLLAFGLLGVSTLRLRRNRLAVTESPLP